MAVGVRVADGLYVITYKCIAARGVGRGAWGVGRRGVWGAGCERVTLGMVFTRTPASDSS